MMLRFGLDTLTQHSVDKLHTGTQRHSPKYNERQEAELSIFDGLVIESQCGAAAAIAAAAVAWLHLHIDPKL